MPTTNKKRDIILLDGTRVYNTWGGAEYTVTDVPHQTLVRTYSQAGLKSWKAINPENRKRHGQPDSSPAESARQWVCCVKELIKGVMTRQTELNRYKSKL